MNGYSFTKASSNGFDVSMAIEVYQTSLPSFLAPSTRAECCVDWAYRQGEMKGSKTKSKNERKGRGERIQMINRLSVIVKTLAWNPSL